jgi:lipopolysaccharide transport protein LptA
MTRALLLALLIASQALPAAEPAPTRLHASRIEIDQRTGESRYHGGVRLQQAGLALNADTAQARHNGQQLAQVDARGEPLRFQVTAEDGQLTQGAAQAAQYDVANRRLTLNGAVKLRRPDARLEATVLRYDIAAGSFEAEGGNPGRLAVEFTPPVKKESAP